MKLSFENLGALSVGELYLADLTVICGENNTGKTYLTYALYGLLRTWDSFMKLPEFDLTPLRKNGIMEIDLQKKVIMQATDILHQTTEEYCANLYRVLSAQSNRFTTTELHLALDFTGVLDKLYHREFTTDRNRRIISCVKETGSPLLNINTAEESANQGLPPRPPFRYQSFIDRVVKEICFAPILPQPFIVSTERTGAVTFQSELNLSRNRLFELALEVKGAENPSPDRLMDQVYGGGYPVPVKDNVDFINSLAAVQSQESELSKAHPDILEDFAELIGGSYKMQNNALHFVVKGVRGVRLRMGESSSSVRSLVILGYYLKHQARPGDLLMIDEPELNLHPANQRKLARLLARLVSVGIKVFLTTHSDYIIKEFNTLIMLNHDSSEADAVRSQYHYKPQDRLAYERVRVYMLRKDFARKSGNQRQTKVPTLCEAPINPMFGIELASFDDTINEMNAIQDTLYYGLNPGGKA